MERLLFKWPVSICWAVTCKSLHHRWAFYICQAEQILVQHPCLLCILLSNRQKIMVFLFCWRKQRSIHHFSPHLYIYMISHYVSCISVFLGTWNFSSSIKSNLHCHVPWQTSDITIPLLSSPPLNPSNWIRVVVFSEVASAAGIQCILSIGVLRLTVGRKAGQRRGQKERDTKCAWVRGESRTYALFHSVA